MIEEGLLLGHWWYFKTLSGIYDQKSSGACDLNKLILELTSRRRRCTIEHRTKTHNQQICARFSWFAFPDQQVAVVNFKTYMATSTENQVVDQE